MTISAKQVRDWYRTAASSSYTATAITRAMLIESLSPRAARVYGLILRNGPITSRGVADALDISIQNASNLCHQLYVLDLVWRDGHKDESGKYWKWHTEP
jgi:DNA-binding MarR family transcriptional regulator